MNIQPMNKGEREILQRLVGKREKVLKSAAKSRSADLLADFENQMASEYSFDDDAVWAEAEKSVRGVVEKAQKHVSVRSRELGIPDRFAPSRLHRARKQADYWRSHFALWRIIVGEELAPIKPVRRTD